MKLYVELHPETDCHEFTGHINIDGYGDVWFLGQYVEAHRLSFILYKGAIPLGHVVRHTCDNRRCVNPAHLIVGTPADNVKDMVERNRHRTRHTYGMTKDKIAENKITRRRRTWKEADERKRARAKGEDVPLLPTGIAPGELHSTAKLTEKEVYEIRASNKTGRELAAQYGVSVGQISKIRNRKLWAHLPEQQPSPPDSGKPESV